MAANGSGLQWETLRHPAIAWVLAMPMTTTLSTGLFLMFVNIFQRLAAPTMGITLAPSL